MYLVVNKKSTATLSSAWIEQDNTTRYTFIAYLVAILINIGYIEASFFL